MNLTGLEKLHNNISFESTNNLGIFLNKKLYDKVKTYIMLYL